MIRFHGILANLPIRALVNHAILIAGVIFLVAPIALIFFSSTHDTGTLLHDGLQMNWGGNFTQNYQKIIYFKAGLTDHITPLGMLQNSLIIAIAIGVLTTALSFLTAFAIVFMRFAFAQVTFWLVFTTLLFPLESRFINTFEVTSNIGLINTHMGIILPALMLALGTFFFRQYFMTLPEELLEAAMLDGAGPGKFLWDIVIPLSWSRAGAIFIIAFMTGWNQYLWPLMISTDDSLYTLVRGIRLIGQNSGPGMALIIITILPPFLLLLAFQKWFFKYIAIGESR